MGKQTHKLYTVEVRGNTKAGEGTEDMLKSVVEALQSQFPTQTINVTTTDLADNKKPLIMVPVQVGRKRA